MSQDLLQGIYLFKDLDSSELEVIQSICNVNQYGVDDDIFQQDESAMALHIIKSGTIRIHQKSSSGDNIEVAVLGDGSHFGEMSFVDKAKRSATATAVDKSEVIQIDFSKLEELLKSNQAIAVKFYRSLAHFLGGRLRITTNDLSYARERNLRYF